jgi:hypothetical protein
MTAESLTLSERIRNLRNALELQRVPPQVMFELDDVLCAVHTSATTSGWENCVGYLQDSMCSYPYGLPASSGAAAFLDRLRAAGLAKP